MKKLLILAMLAAPAAHAAFKCTDEKGRTHFGDTPPAQCSSVVMYEVSPSGTVLRKIEPSLTPEQARAKQEETLRRQEQEKRDSEQRRKDIALLATYGSEKDIDTSREINLKPIEARIKTAQDRIKAVEKRQKQLNEEMEFYKAGSSKAGAKTKGPPAQLTQDIEHGGADVPCHGDVHPRPLEQQAGEPRGGRLAVRAGDAEDLRCVALLGLQARQFAREELDLADYVDLLCFRVLEQRGDARVGGREAGADGDQLHPVEQRWRELAANELGGRTVGREARAPGRFGARIGNAQFEPAHPQPAGHRKAAVAESEDECAGGRSHRAARCGAISLRAVSRVAHRSFNVESPTSTSIMLMIQNRTTTCVSFQPDSSKWWCSGAMRKIRLPLVHLK
jgi:hypothetical protein